MRLNIALKVTALAVVTAPGTHVVRAAEPANTVNGLEEIIVTAQKREENLQELPASLAVVSGENLQQQGVVNARNLDTLVSSAVMGVDREVVQFHIRGIGSVDNSPRFDPGTILNLDGVYQPPLMTSGAFLDVSRVEVLKGPQGILYGRSALGGAVNVVSNRPTREFEASGSVAVGNYDAFNATGVVNVPLSEQLQVRAALDANRHDGYLSTGFSDLDSKTARLRVLYAPTDDLSILLTGAYYHNGGMGGATVYYPYVDPDDPYHTLPPPTDFPGITYGNEATTRQIYGELKWNFSGLTLTWLPRYSTNQGDASTPIANLVLDRHAKLRVHSQELRLSDDGTGRLQWLAGLFYFHSSETAPKNDSIFRTSPTIITSVSQSFEALETSYAGFGQITYSVSDRMRLTAGGRFSVDEKEGTSENQTFNSLTGLPLGPVALTTFDHTWRRGDFKLGVDFDLSDQVLGYVNVQTGYKPGGYTLAAYMPGTTTLIPSKAVDPERMTGYSIGLKSRFLDSRLQINDEMFYYDYRGFQQATRDLVTKTSTYYNAEKVRVYGNDFDITAILTQNDQFDLGVSLLKSENIDFTIGTVSYNGNPLPNSPEVSVTAGHQHTWNLDTGASFVGTIRASYVSKQWYTFDLQPLTDIGAHTLVNLNLTYYSPGKRWNLAVYVNNVGDEVATYGAAQTNPQTNPPYPGSRYLRDPRTYGVRLSATF